MARRRAGSRYSAAFGKAIAGSAAGACSPGCGSSMRLPRLNRRDSQPRRPGLRFSRVKTISMDGVTMRVSTVAKDSPNLFGDYEKKPLPDGTFELVTPFKKV